MTVGGLERVLELLDQQYRLTRERLVMGGKQYGDLDFLGPHRNLRQDAREESADSIGYNIMSLMKILDSNRIYVAGPYSTGDTARNVADAKAVGQELMRRGWVPFVPHTMTHLWDTNGSGLEYEDFVRLGLAWLQQCGRVVLFGNWPDSPGVARELALARRLGLKIYETLADVPRWED